jgi:hypothetical protein
MKTLSFVRDDEVPFFSYFGDTLFEVRANLQ